MESEPEITRESKVIRFGNKETHIRSVTYHNTSQLRANLGQIGKTSEYQHYPED